MTENWKGLKKSISENVSHVFENADSPFKNYEKSLDLFKKLLYHKTGITKIDGLNESVLDSISEIYNSKPGKTNPIENLLNNIEPFLKKIIYLTKSQDHTDDNKKNLIFCLKDLGLIANQQLDQTTLSSYDDTKFLHSICNAYIGRNSFHNSPKLNAIQVLKYAESAIVVMLHAIQLHERGLESIVGETLTNDTLIDQYRGYTLNKLKHNPTLQMIEGDFGIKLEAIGDFEVKIKAKAKKREEEASEYLKNKSNNLTVPLKLLPEIEGIISNSKSIIIHGIATSGKSTILKKLGKDFLEKYDSPYLFHIELAELFDGKKNKDVTILKEIKNRFKEISTIDLQLGEIQEKVLILLDGLDEIPTKEIRQSIIEQVINFEKNKNIQIVLSSRTNEYILNDEILEQNFDKFELLPLNISDIISIGNKILGNGSSFDNFVKIVKKNSLLKAFPKTPLTSILLAILFKDNNFNIKEMPKNVTELYRKFTDLFLNRWDRTKGLGEQYIIQKKELVLQLIAEHMQLNNWISISSKDLQDFIHELSENKPIGSNGNTHDIISDLCERTNILIRDEYDDSYKFFHLTIQEYLASQRFDYKSDDMLVKNFFQEWWLNPNIFYAGLKTEYPNVLNRIANFEIYPADDEQKFNFIAHTSKVLLAAHNLDNSVRNHVLRSMFKIFDEFIKELIHDLVIPTEFTEKSPALSTKANKIKNQTLLNVILGLRDMFLEFFSFTDFQKELTKIWEELIYQREKLPICDISLYCLSYCLSIKSQEAKYLEDFTLTEVVAINSRWFRIVEVDINIKKLKNTRKNVVLKIKHNANKNNDYIQKQFKEKINKHFKSITGIIE